MKIFLRAGAGGCDKFSSGRARAGVKKFGRAGAGGREKFGRCTFLEVLTMSASSASSGRKFSSADCVISSRHYGRNPENLESLVYLNA